MGYTPSAVARSLVTRRTCTIGLAVAWVSDPFLAQLVRGAEDTALQHGYTVFLSSFYDEPGREREVLAAFRERRVDGIIVKSSRLVIEHDQLLANFGMPLVVINRPEHNYSVSTDNFHGGRLATEYLLDLGHTRIGYIAAERGARTNQDRLEAYKAALEERGIGFDPALVVFGDGYAQGGKEAMKRLLALPSPPTAVFCYNDLTAMGAAMAVREAGLQVPDDISLVGFDDIELATYFQPPLTTVRQPAYELGRRAMEMVFALLEDGKDVPNVVLKGELVVRQSCRRL
ncbi:MAG: LacI family transcriptional regulator [Chloroflexi bacterium]|nr:MAG: LacI family transcriptional regulator [Chloroflexota bacterium]